MLDSLFTWAYNIFLYQKLVFGDKDHIKARDILRKVRNGPTKTQKDQYRDLIKLPALIRQRS